MTKKQILRGGLRLDKAPHEALSTQSKRSSHGTRFPFTGHLQLSIHSFVSLTPTLLVPGQRIRPRYKEKKIIPTTLIYKVVCFWQLQCALLLAEAADGQWCSPSPALPHLLLSPDSSLSHLRVVTRSQSKSKMVRRPEVFGKNCVA